MAVTVILARYIGSGGGGPSSTDIYESANALAIEDGHLRVQKVSGTSRSNLGVYAPGQWESAYKDDTMTRGKPKG